MKKTFGVSLLTGDTKEKKYKHERLLELYRDDIVEGRKYLAIHIGYFISHTKWNVSEQDYNRTASEAISIIDHQINKQITKFGDEINPIKLGRYLILRLWGHLMNTHINNSKLEISTYDEEYSEVSVPIGYDDFDDRLSLIGLDDIELKVVSMKMRSVRESEIFLQCNLNRKGIKDHYHSGMVKIKKYYASQGFTVNQD